MGVQAALGEERAGDDGEGDHPEGEEQEAMLDEVGESAGYDEEDEKRGDARRLALRGCRAVSVQQAVERADEGAHPHHRVADGAGQPLGIAEHRLEQQGQQCQ